MSGLVRFFRKQLKGKMTKEGGQREKKVEKEDDSEGIGNNKMALNNMVLPEEMLQKIFSYLSSLQDLNTVMLVCKTWKNAGEAPALWSWFIITKSSQLTLKRLKRLQGSQEICIDYNWNNWNWNGFGNMFSWNGLCQEILQHPGLKKISLGYSATWEHISFGVDPELMIDADELTKVFAKMEEIEIHKLSPYYSCRAVENGGAIVNCVLDAILDRSNN